ncbi:MAG: Uma2 family endonuclease [Acidobacteria bacterium]|nr:Uma2 family endonuclease [Acidobacteriota bacterium]
MATPQTRLKISPEEYLRFEREAEERHEFDNGRIYAMAGEGVNHNRIYINLVALMNTQLKEKNCEAFSLNMKIGINTAGKFVYPDLSIVRGKPIFHDTEKDVLLNPKMIVEVLSPSTEKYDRSAKFQAYQQLESLTDFLLISQDKPLVEHFARQSSGQWLYTAYKGLESIVQLPSIECGVPLAELYERVEFPPEDELEPEV